MARLNGKVAFVTGGSRGIGEAIVRRLAQEGAAVAFTYVSSSSEERARRLTAEIAAAGGKAKAYRVDSGDARALQAAVDSVAAEHGRLDVLVNNAGVAILKPIGELTLEDFERTVAINVRSVFIGSQAAARHMQEGGRIITIGSVNGERMPFAGGALYSLSKSALIGLTKGLSRDLGPRGITVNLVAPGPVDTDMNPENGPFAQMLKGLMALPRYGRSEEVAGLVAYLASAEAAFVTGGTVTIDGGFGA